MKKGKHIYSLFHKCTAVFLILALLWLTVSTPFVMSAQEKAKTEKTSSLPDSGNEEETSKTPGNTTEEKVPNSGNSLSEEYIHDHYLSHSFFSVASNYHKCENADTYIAFHGELLVPPPNAA